LKEINDIADEKLKELVNDIRKNIVSYMPRLIGSPSKIASDMATKIRDNGLNIVG